MLNFHYSILNWSEQKHQVSANFPLKEIDRSTMIFSPLSFDFAQDGWGLILYLQLLPVPLIQARI